MAISLPGITTSGFTPNSAPIPGEPSTIPGTPAQVVKLGDFVVPTSGNVRDLNGRFVKNGWGFEWTGLTQLFNLPQAFGDALGDGIEDMMENLREEIEDYAKQNAPWTDHTGKARNGLKAVLVGTPSRLYTISLGYSVSYGFYLENSNGGIYAIVTPTLREFAPEMEAIRLDAATYASELGPL